MSDVPADSPPLPIEVVRDLLGIARAAYALQRRKGNHAIAARLRRAGEDLRRALALAVRDGSALAHRKAWQLASSATVVITTEVRNAQESLSQAVDVTARRLETHQRASEQHQRELRRAARIKRG